MSFLKRFPTFSTPPTSPPAEPTTPNTQSPRPSLDQPKLSTSRTFPLGPDSAPHTPQSITSVTAPDSIVGEQGNNHEAISPQNSASTAAAARIAELRRIFIPHSVHINIAELEEVGTTPNMDQTTLQALRKLRLEEMQHDTAVGSGAPPPKDELPTQQSESVDSANVADADGLPPPEHDILSHILTLISHAKPHQDQNYRTCRICAGELDTFPKQYAWRVSMCGHWIHVTCFRSLRWLEAPASEEDKCIKCEALRLHGLSIGREELTARIQRLEGLRVPCKKCFHVMEGNGRGECAEVSSEERRGTMAHKRAWLRQGASAVKGVAAQPERAREQTLLASKDAEAVRKQDWRKSAPAGADLTVLEGTWQLNPGHPVFERMSRTG